MSIDGRPGTGQLLALAVNPSGGATDGKLYWVDPDTGAATPTGTPTFDVDDTALRTTIDINPTVDRLRVVGTDARTCVSTRTTAPSPSPTPTSSTRRSRSASNQSCRSPTTATWPRPPRRHHHAVRHLAERFARDDRRGQQHAVAEPRPGLRGRRARCHPRRRAHRLRHHRPEQRLRLDDRRRRDRAVHGQPRHRRGRARRRHRQRRPRDPRPRRRDPGRRRGVAVHEPRVPRPARRHPPDQQGRCRAAPSSSASPARTASRPTPPRPYSTSPSPSPTPAVSRPSTRRAARCRRRRP